MQQEGALLDRTPEVGEQRQPARAVDVELGGVHRHARVRLLGHVHRDVGALQQRVDVGLVVGRHRDAHARVDLEHQLVHHERLAQGLQELLGDDRRRSRLAEEWQEHGELVASQTGHAVGVAQHGREARGDAPQEGIALVMAERVVDVLEAVEVDEDQADALRLRDARWRSRARRGRAGASGWADPSARRAAPGGASSAACRSSRRRAPAITRQHSASRPRPAPNTMSVPASTEDASLRSRANELCAWPERWAAAS